MSGKEGASDDEWILEVTLVPARGSASAAASPSGSAANKINWGLGSVAPAAASPSGIAAATSPRRWEPWEQYNDGFELGVDAHEPLNDAVRRIFEFPPRPYFFCREIPLPSFAQSSTPLREGDVASATGDTFASWRPEIAYDIAKGDTSAAASPSGTVALRCAACNVYFLDEDSLEIHVRGSEHINACEAYWRDEDCRYCDLCDMWMQGTTSRGLDGLEYHYKGKKHLKNLKRLRLQQYDLIPKPDFITTKDRLGKPTLPGRTYAAASPSVGSAGVPPRTVSWLERGRVDKLLAKFCPGLLWRTRVHLS